MSRFMFESDDPESDVISGTPQQDQLIHMISNEMAVLTGCSQCPRRLVEDDKPVPGAKIVYLPGENQETGEGTPLCAECYKRLHG